MGVVINPKMDAILTTLGKIKDDIKGLGFAAKGSGDIVSFPDSIGGFNVNRITADLAPVQNLNGQDAPYPAGGGKNKLPITGTTTTTNGITFTVNSDGTIKVNGTATANAFFNVVTNLTLPSGNYLLTSGGVGGQETAGLYVAVNGVYYWAGANEGTGVAVPVTSTAFAATIRVLSGATISNMIFKPMLRLSSETDATFAPYENICPILGHTEVETTGAGKNLCPMFKTETKNGATITVDANGVVTPSGTASAQTTFFKECVLNAGTYRLFGAPTGSANGSYDFYATNMETSAVVARCYETASTSLRTFTLDKVTNMRFNVRVPQGAVDTSKKFYPMALLTSETDTTYEPYIGTSVLTEIGINQWDEIGEYGGINSSTGADTSSTTTWRSKNYIPVTQGQMIYAKTGSVAIYCRWYDANKAYLGAYDATGGHGSITNGVLTAPTNACYFRFVLDARPNDGIISINYPARFTDYYPYTGIGAVYGGTLDVTSGKLTATMRVLSTAGLVAANISTVQTVGSLTRFWLYIANKTVGAVQCDRAKTSNGSTYSQEIVELYGADPTYPQSIWMKLPTALVGTTAASILTYLQTSGIQIAYTLAEPKVYQLEPQAVQTVLGQNNIYTDSGEVNVWYVAGLS